MEIQKPLFELIPDKEFIGPGENRSRSGAAMEEIIRAMFCLEPGLKTGKVCPDAFNHCDKPVEIKSLRKRDKLVVYDWRMDKDLDDTLYFIGVHNRGPKNNLRDVWVSLSETVEEVLVVRKELISKLALREPLRRIKTQETASGSRNGYQRKGYRNGYRNVPFAKLYAECVTLPFKVSAELHGLRFCASVSVESDLFKVPTYPCG